MSSGPTPVPTPPPPPPPTTSSSQPDLQPPVTTPNVLLALQSLQTDPDPARKRAANEWLSEFQHTVPAWNVCHELVSSPDIPMQGRMLGAQTFRSKITYDLSQLPQTQLRPLLDSLLTHLHTYSRPSSPSGSRAIIIQLCLAVADLAFQMPEWSDVIPSMIERFGRDPQGVVVLLEFLKVLVEESENTRLPISSQQAADRCQQLLTYQAEKVLELLVMYMQAPGVTIAIQTACFETLRAWLATGEMYARTVAESPLFSFAFDAVKSDSLFDAAVDVIQDLIHETQEVEDNVEVVQMIVPRVIELRSRLHEVQDDPDTVRGLCRIFAEAGETYQVLLLQHPETFLPLVETIGEFSAYPDLDIVPITFNFWWKLAQNLTERDPTGENPAYLPYRRLYAKLQDDMIRHLQFPPDESEVSPAERDEFRSFRHYMGDTLKDCCEVLGADVCMKRSYELVAAAMNKPGGFVWQEIEAPLFSMRSMGARVDPNDDEVLPHIMDMLPQLPSHNKIRYAALLVISRYTEWIDKHPSYLEFQLNYISTGFEIVEDDVSSAAAQAMKFMCEDCKQHLVPYLPQLYSFITTAALKLPIEDRLEVAEAIGYVISHMPANDSAMALQKFAQPLITQMQELLTKDPGSVTKEEVQPALDAMEQLESYLVVVKQIEPLPITCKDTAGQVYDVMDQLFAKFYTSYSISDRLCRLLRRGINFFPYDRLHDLLPRVLARLASCFEASGHAAYIWIIGHIASAYGKEVGPLNLQSGNEVELALISALERTTAQTKQLEAAMSAEAIPDVLEDFLQMTWSYLHRISRIVLPSPCLPAIVELALASLSLPALQVVMTSLDVLVEIFKAASAARSSIPPAASAIDALSQQYGPRIISAVVSGLITTFPEESIRLVNDLVKEMCQVNPTGVQGWLAQSVHALPSSMLPDQDKADVQAAFSKAFAEGNVDQVRNAMNTFFRAARRVRDRKTRTRIA